MNCGPGIILNVRVTNLFHLLKHFLEAQISYNIERRYKHILISSLLLAIDYSSIAPESTFFRA